MWKPQDPFTNRVRFSLLACVLALFLIASFLVVSGLPGRYAAIIAVLGGFIVSVLAFRRSGNPDDDSSREP